LSESSPVLDKDLVRRRFARTAGSYASASRVEAEAASRMLERLEYVKLAPRRILDAGSGAARDAASLTRRYPGAAVLAVDSACATLPRPGWKQRVFGTKTNAVCADIERLPFAEGSFDLAWCNMALHWLNDPLAALRELERVLVPEGLVMLSTLGPDTLKELRAAAGATRVHAFADMHDVGASRTRAASGCSTTCARAARPTPGAIARAAWPGAHGAPGSGAPSAGRCKSLMSSSTATPGSAPRRRASRPRKAFVFSSAFLESARSPVVSYAPSVSAPHCSISPAGFACAVASLACVALAIGAGFAVLGAWLVLPFSGLEVLMLGAAFAWHARDISIRDRRT
jgi:SAM-dependent methyltransferase